ncbi:c-type cytochrome biogenesis protein CcmI [Dongia sedimenti]|uniref:C-type cytochrome biogenesis protein CcmI n=1 Tax=Dongia sedimenti TaxID=3064282 RepID=A0ABU0YL87_9PROT|nr:c-type cytochrome biogenesis protein CcmI [Rhodospirillaceae bacterium R-7]
MILLWIILGVMTLTAALILAWPLFDSRRFKNDSSFALAVYRDQLAEINHDAARGILDETQARAAQIEIERRILALADAPKFQPAKAPAPLLIIAMAVVLPLGAFGLYLHLGSPGLPGQPAQGLADSVAASPELQALQAAVEKAPTDPAAWRDLGEGLMVARRPNDAANAFARALGLGDRDPKLQSRYGSALVLASQGRVEDKARAAFAAALAADPTDPIARFFTGLAKEQGGDPTGALTDWLALERDLPADVPWHADLTQNIDRVARGLGKDPATLPGRAPAANATPQAGGAPSPSDLDAAAKMSDSERQAFIESMVGQLAERLKAAPDDLDGWLRLAKAYSVLGKHDEARAAWAKAAALAPTRLDVQLEYANALIEGSSDLSKTLPPNFAETVTKIRTLAPDNPLGLYYGGLVARSQGDKQAAKDMWLKVLALIPEGSAQRASLQREIDSLGP